MTGQQRRIAVIDIGKTNAKVALVDLDGPAEVAVRKTPNTVVRGDPYPHYDVDWLWSFVLESLAGLHSAHGIDAISVTTHGATAALVRADGNLALPVLDYEYAGPESLRAEYEAVRPPFVETGTPPMKNGLNLGAQLFWQQRMFPKQFADAKWLLMYPQYWSFRLSGVAAGEVTSLACHGDLWQPGTHGYSAMVGRLGWKHMLPPIRKAGDRLGPVRPEIARQAGLDPATPVLCGIHDSNASLLPHLLAETAPFAVVSTGTWVVCMAIGGRPVVLDPRRDTLFYVNALGDAVPSAKFMGGREFEAIAGSPAKGATQADVAAVLADGAMLLPTMEQGTGPFPDFGPRWLGREPRMPGERTAAASLYVALVTATALDLIGAEGPVLVEGPFSANAEYRGMLAAATGRAVRAGGGTVTGTSIGAALLATMEPLPRSGAAPAEAPPPSWRDYAQRWKAAVAER
jgi:sugar (pentulose or hexulose) kinase